MLSAANISVPDALREFKKHNLDVAFIAPTENALDKSIIDTTVAFRDLLMRNEIHDFAEQQQGTAHKIYVPTILFSDGRIEETKTSLYRPETKSGDPRFCIYGISKSASAGDLLGICILDGQLLIVNCSKSNLTDLFSFGGSYPVSSFTSTEDEMSDIAKELIEKLKDISNRGYIKTLRSGNTGVGFTLESLLGIQANSSRKPDYKGIELKSGRVNTHARGQVQLFSQVPDWKKSRLKNGLEILNERGRFKEDEQRVQLYHEMSTKSPNSYDMQLDLDSANDRLVQFFVNTEKTEFDVQWALAKLRTRLHEKHNETMWITAENQGRGTEEEFWYKKLKHTWGADEVALCQLLESGDITLHYTLSVKPNGTANDHGYLFKTALPNIELLFAESREHTL
jgi:hypothetical protein